MINFAAELNPEQLSVVEQGDGACLVLAGAGSGKTRTITYRVAKLLEQGVSPENILLVTFTNKAADEMKSRVQHLTGMGKTLPWSGTFHHIGYRILRAYAPLLGYAPNFTVLDTDDSNALIKICVKDLPSVPAGKKFPSAAVIHNIISYARNAELTVAEVIDRKFPAWVAFEESIVSVAAAYAQKKKEANAMDFDDLLTNLLVLLNNDRAREKYATQFQYVLVDEYQDTNKIQASIIQRFASVHKNILVVGDDAQSIYSFRAADIQNILSFDKQYSGAKIFKLTTNYRSTQPILELANNVIENNRNQFQKSLHTLKKDGVKPALYPQLDQTTEGAWVAEKIVTLLKNGTPEKEIAVLFRAAFHSQMLELELTRLGIPYDYRGGVRFFERAHVKDILSYLRILNNLADTAAWLRVLMHEDGIGPAAAQKVIEAIRKAVGKEKTITDLQAVAEIGRSVLGGKAQLGWNNFLKIWNTLVETLVHAPAPSNLINALVDSAYSDYVETEYVDSRERLEDLKQLAVFAARYTELETFLAEATLQESFATIADNADQGSGEQKNNKNKIVLSTIHQAKGLEWSAVFILNLSSGAFPSDRALREDNGLEEERRLFYVAITRAKEKLFLTYPMAGGMFGDFLSGPSSFLSEINNDLLDDHSLLSTDSSVFNDSLAGVSYVSEDEFFPSKPKKIRPGSLLVSVDDL